MKVYINGVRATKADLDELTKNLKNGTVKAVGHFTKKGNIGYKTYD